ncbi:hypothetical protein T265_10975 [Opisthorchis viverrini]|uniref:Uncharacterized protein n=1 Tax=Opisthorchis viverrini TaxID=6198 RepID=A0A074Z0C4_OPIVI|nr:hypothetical protein T265_10975 [Opisthorchis viverrini]KER20491.1 hypothetical protein T265_10975 [Opisthorchis viverrini]
MERKQTPAAMKVERSQDTQKARQQEKDGKSNRSTVQQNKLNKYERDPQTPVSTDVAKGCKPTGPSKHLRRSATKSNRFWQYKLGSTVKHHGSSLNDDDDTRHFYRNVLELNRATNWMR